MINFLSGAMDHDGGVLLLHGVKIPWLDDVAPIHKPYPPQPDQPVDGRHHFPVTWDIYKNKDYSAPGHYGTLGHGLFHSNQTRVVFFRNPHRGLFAMIQPQMLEAALEKMELVADWNLYLDDIGYWCDYVFAAGHQFEGGKLDLRLYYPKYPCLVGGAPVQKPPGDQIGWGTLARQIGLAVAPEYWTTDGSRDPDKAFVDNRSDEAVRSVEAAGSYKEFIEKGAFWIDKNLMKTTVRFGNWLLGPRMAGSGSILTNWSRRDMTAFPDGLPNGMYPRDPINFHCSSPGLPG